MSCFKIIYYEKAGIKNNTYIDAAKPADILTTFLTVDKLPTRWNEDFVLERSLIIYDEDQAIVKNDSLADSVVPAKIVSFSKLEDRFNKMLEYLVVNDLIDDRISDLESLDDSIEITKAGLRPHDLAVALQFIATIIDVKKNTGFVSF